jgi:hypothetical protein
MVPLEKVVKKPEPAEKPATRRRPPAPTQRSRPAQPAKPHEREKSSTPLPPGHVRKKGTGEIGRIQAVDAKAGTATVQWLKRGGTSTVPLSAVSRR